MADIDVAAHEEYAAWLRKEVARHCNAEGRAEVYWDYMDSLSPDQIITAFRQEPENPRAFIERQFWDDFDLVSEPEQALLRALEGDLGELSDAAQDLWYESDDLMGDLEAAGYNGVDLKLDDLVRQSTFRVNVMFATPEERNRDFGSIVAAYGNDYRRDDPLDLTEADAPYFDNALSYLVNQQGYGAADVYDELEGWETHPASKFLGSVRQEINNLPCEAMCEVTALLSMDGETVLSFLDAVERGVERGEGAIVLAAAARPTIGLFNEWAGGGSVLGIELDRDAVLPMSMVAGFQIEGQTKRTLTGYTVDDVYGLGDPSLWSAGFGRREGAQPDAREDYAEAVAHIRQKAVRAEVEEAMTENHEARTTLSAEARSASRASAELGGDDPTLAPEQAR